MSRGDFWSRRKAAVEAEALAEERLVEDEARAAHEEELAERSDEELLEELGLPDPDTLSEGDDFKVFLTEKVPARLRTRALRRLWMTNPVLANVDGLVDYGEDFTDASCVIENLQTAYQVGKGMTAHVQELLRQFEEDDEATAAGEPEETGEEIDEAAPELVAEIEAPAAPEETYVADVFEAPIEEQVAQAPRRMRFSFETEGQAV